MTSRVVGLDLSLTRPAAVALGQDGELLAYDVSGYKIEDADDSQKVARLLSIADWVVDFVGKHCGEDGPAAVAVEGYAFGKSFGREALAELQGHVKASLFSRLGVVTKPIPPASARKEVGLKLRQQSVRRKVGGKFVTRKQPGVLPVKEQVRQQLGDRGLHFPPKSEGGDDVMDAWVVATALWRRLHEAR